MMAFVVLPSPVWGVVTQERRVLVSQVCVGVCILRFDLGFELGIEASRSDSWDDVYLYRSFGRVIMLHEK